MNIIKNGTYIILIKNKTNKNNNKFTPLTKINFPIIIKKI